MSSLKNAAKLICAGMMSFTGLAVCAEDPYILSDGLSGINTGYHMKGGISRVELDYQLTDISQSGQFRLIGMPLHEKLGTIIYFINTEKTQSTSLRAYVNEAYGGGVIGEKSFGCVDTSRRTASVDLKNNKLSIATPSATVSSAFSKSSDPSYVATFPISICGQFTDETLTKLTYTHVKTKIYGVKFYEDDILVRNFIPAKSGEAVGLFDLITRKFVEPTGGTWEASDNVKEVPYAKEVPYVILDGTSAFNTGYRLKGGVSRVELDCAATELTSQARYFDYGGAFERSLQARAYINMSGNTRFTILQDVNSDGELIFNDDNRVDCLCDYTYGNQGNRRTTWIVDLAKNTCGYAFEKGYSVSKFGVASPAGTDADYPFAIGGIFTSDKFSAIQYGAKLNVYGARIFENGKLVRNFIPAMRVSDNSVGLYDVMTRTFILPTGGACTYAGDIEKVDDAHILDDAYILSNGTTGMSTGYKMKGGISRVEMDYALTTTEASAQWSILGDLNSYMGLQLEFNITGTRGENGALTRVSAKDEAKYFSAPDTKRHTAYADYFNGKCCFLDAEAVLNKRQNVNATLPLPVFASYEDSSGEVFKSDKSAVGRWPAKMKVYSVRFYEKYVIGGVNTPVRELIPYSKDGVVGFYDTVSGEIVSNDKAADGAFTYHGGSVDGELMAYISPDHAAKLKVGETTTLKAYAPLAASYRWYRNGVEIPGETGNTLTVEWRRRGPDGLLVDSYTVKAVYPNADCEPTETEASAPVSVSHTPVGFVLTIL